MPRKLKVKSIHQTTASLSDQDLNEVWEVYGPHHNVSREEWQERVRKHLSHLTRYRNGEGKIIGCTGVREEIFTLKSGRKAYTVYSGMSYIDPTYRGLHLLPRTLSHYSIRLKLANPLRRVYVWSDAISYKPYVLTARSTRKFYPSRKFTTPPHIQELIGLVGHKFYGEAFDPATGTVNKSSNRLKSYVAPLSEKDLRDPDIRFFAEKNPGYAKGDGLLNVIPITFLNLFISAVNATWKSMRRKRKASRNSESKISYAHN